MSVREITLRLTNSLPQELTLYLEPWGVPYKMAAGATFTVDAKGPDGDTLELEYDEGTIKVYGWSGSVVTISTTVTPG